MPAINIQTGFPNAHAHVVMRFKGHNADMEDVFHAIMKKFDKDYPIDPMRRPDEKVAVCTVCKGLEWKSPSCIITPTIMKQLATQCGLKLKIHRYDVKCMGKTEMKELTV